MDPKTPTPFTVPFSVNPTVAAQMWALSVMLKDQEKARERKSKIIEAEIEAEIEDETH
jgi:hypothetical protein